MNTFIGVVLCITWLGTLYVSVHQWKQAPQAVHEKAAALTMWRRAFAPIGWKCLEMSGWQHRSGFTEKRREALRVLVDPYHVEEVLLTKDLETMSDVGAWSALAAPAFLFHPVAGVGFLIALAAYVYSRTYALQSEARRVVAQMEQALPDMLTQIVLSLRAGSLPFAAWKTTAEKGHGALYQEMRRVVHAIEGGEGMRSATAAFGRHVPMKSLHDVAALFSQTVEVGGADLAVALERMRSSLYQEQKRQYAMQAERCSQQMLFPSLLLFVGILLLVLVPMLRGM